MSRLITHNAGCLQQAFSLCPVLPPQHSVPRTLGASLPGGVARRTQGSVTKPFLFLVPFLRVPLEPWWSCCPNRAAASTYLLRYGCCTGSNLETQAMCLAALFGDQQDRDHSFLPFYLTSAAMVTQSSPFLHESKSWRMKRSTAWSTDTFRRPRDFAQGMC